MRNFYGKKPTHTEINITSLIDVIFMLVIFFMIGASFEKPAIALTLPRAASGTAQDRIFVTVSVDAEGRVYFDRDEIEKAELAARFTEYGTNLRNVTVALECDGRTVFDNVVAVMDTIKLAGVRNVAIRHEW
jgi:biopolymer transport protein ExbD